MSSTASPATHPAVRAGPGGHERDGPSTAISPRPGPAPCAAGPRPRAGPGFRGSIKIRRAGGRGGGRARVLRGPSPSPTAVRCSKRGAKLGPLSTTRCAHGVDLHPLDPPASPTRRIISAPGAAVDAIPFPVLGTGLRQRVGIHRPRRGAAGREPGASTPPPARARTGRTTRPPSRPENNHVVRRCASPPPPRTPTPSTGCRAARGSRPDTRVNYPGPHPQAHRVGRRQGRWAQAPAVRPRTPPGRLLDTDAPADAQKDELIDYRNRLNPAVITRRIIELQDVLVRPAKDKTDQHPPRPDPQHPARRPQGHPGQESPPAAPDHAGSSTRGTEEASRAP